MFFQRGITISDLYAALRSQLSDSHWREFLSMSRDDQYRFIELCRDELLEVYRKKRSRRKFLFVLALGVAIFIGVRNFILNTGKFMTIQEIDLNK
jgi:hypothetical protein